MGVHGLWKLLEPAGKPVPLESLENKVLAVDVSIWMYQLTKGFQTTGGGIVPNAHILGLFNRICKLLYYRIKPVFVFDGGVPQLKKETIEARKRQKLKSQDISEKLRQRLLDNLLKQKAVRDLLGDDVSPSYSYSNSNRNDETDIFALPPLPEPNDDEIDDEDDDTEISSAKIESFCNHQYGKDVHSIDINSEQFKSLPAEIRHEILSELQETRKQSSWARIHEMPEESTDFSKFQMERLVKRRNVQRSLDSAAKEMGGRMMTMGELEEIFHEQGIVTDSLPGRRIASDNVTRYVYLTGTKADKSKSINVNSDEETKFSESNPTILSSSNETVIESEKPKKEIINETEFRENVYAIDQCVFVNSSSSDEDLEESETSGQDYANKLSMEEMMSQVEILKLIKQQNSAPSKSFDNAAPSTSYAFQRPFSDHSDIEDEPDPVTFPGGSTWNSGASSRISSNCSSPDISSKETTDFKKSMTQLDKLINAVKSSGTDEHALSKSSPEPQFDTRSVHSISESDSDDFIEVTEENAKSQYFRENKNQTIEISVNPSKIEDDLFADVFKSETMLKPAKKEMPAVNDQQIASASLKNTNGQFHSASSPTNDEPPMKKNEKHFICQPESERPAAETTLNQKESEITLHKNDDTIPRNLENAEKKSPVDAKTKDRVKNIVEIFNRVRKNNNIQKKLENVENESASKSQDEKLIEVQEILTAEHAELVSEQGKQERFGSTITQQMIVEAQELLQLFGLPYIVAPMEAEAQCAFLDKISLTEGTITDDSDIWLFGGQKVYKNFFDNRKYVLQFRDVDIEHFFKLSREQLIQMAMLVGSDYAVGIEGVGPVTAIEILAYFSDKSNKPETEADIAETLRKFRVWVHTSRRSVSALSKKLRHVSLSEEFPNTSVIEAYLYPTVNESKDGFSWAPPDLDRIRQYMKTKFGWKMSRIDEILLPVMKRLANQNKQTTLDAFFKARPYNAIDSTNVSKRVIQAINIMKNKIDVDVSQLPVKNQRKSSTQSAEQKKRSNKVALPTQSSENLMRRKKTIAPRSVASSPHKSNEPGREIIPQRERDRLEAAKRKMEAVRIFRSNRKNQNSKKKKVLQPKADSSYLSESSDSGNGD